MSQEDNYQNEFTENFSRLTFIPSQYSLETEGGSGDRGLRSTYDPDIYLVRLRRKPQSR